VKLKINSHFDFRLEINGILKSWVIPKDPSMNPEEKCLAFDKESGSIC
jgi:bifunctional non-homologous end joining protein LigD